MLVLTVFQFHRKGVDNNTTPPRFDKHLEEFYSICDQIELHLVGRTTLTVQSCFEQFSSHSRKHLYNVCNNIHRLNDIYRHLLRQRVSNHWRQPKTVRFRIRNTCKRFAHKLPTPKTSTIRLYVPHKIFRRVNKRFSFKMFV